MTAVAPADAGLARLGLGPGGSALVTGASSGIGAAFARALAARGVRLLLTAPAAERERLEELAGALSAGHGVECAVVTADLAERDGAEALHAAAQELAFAPDLLVNNAGVGASGPFTTLGLDTQLPIVHVNVEALVRLTGLFLPSMVGRGAGAIVNVASTAAFQPVPYFAVYSASKAFVRSFGEALWAECEAAGVRVTTVCSGPVETPFIGATDSAPGRRAHLIQADDLVRETLGALEQRRARTVLRMPGLGRLTPALAVARSVVPRSVWLRASGRINEWALVRRAGSGSEAAA
jgi:short-subunit dehydrogenase